MVKSSSSIFNLRQKILDCFNESVTDSFKMASKREIQKSTKRTGDLIDNKFADAVARPYDNKIAAFKSPSNPIIEEKSVEIPTKRCIFPEKKTTIIDELRLI